MDTPTVSKFDRALGALSDLNDTLKSKPSTVIDTSPIVGLAQTYIVQTIRQQEVGDYLFLQYVDDQGSHRFVFPPRVTRLIASQRDSLTARARSKAAKATAQARKDAGIQPAFLKAKKRALK